MHLLRRTFALVILLAASYIAYQTQTNNLGLGGLVWRVVAVVVAFFAFIAVVSNLSINSDGWYKEIRVERSLLSDKWETLLAVATIFLFGTLPIFLALRGIRSGSMPAPWSRPEILLIQEPLCYLFALAVWLGAGCSCVYLSWEILRNGKTKPEIEAD